MSDTVPAVSTTPRPVTLFTGQWADLPFEEVHGDVPWNQIFRMLNSIGYQGPTSIEWEDAGMDRLVGAPQALALVRELARIAPSAAPFDAAFSAPAQGPERQTTKEGS